MAARDPDSHRPAATASATALHIHPARVVGHAEPDRRRQDQREQRASGVDIGNRRADAQEPVDVQRGTPEVGVLPKHDFDEAVDVQDCDRGHTECQQPQRRIRHRRLPATHLNRHRKQATSFQQMQRRRHLRALRPEHVAGLCQPLQQGPGKGQAGGRGDLKRQGALHGQRRENDQRQTAGEAHRRDIPALTAQGSAQQPPCQHGQEQRLGRRCFQAPKRGDCAAKRRKRGHQHQADRRAKRRDETHTGGDRPGYCWRPRRRRRATGGYGGEHGRNEGEKPRQHQLGSGGACRPHPCGSLQRPWYTT